MPVRTAKGHAWPRPLQTPPISILLRLLLNGMSTRVSDMSTNNRLDRLHRYCPRDLPERQWDLARLTAVTAVVATGASTDESAMVLLGHLARFLVWHPAWDRTASPDLESDRPVIERTRARAQACHR